MPFDDTTVRVTCPEVEFLDEMACVLSSPRNWLKGDAHSADGSRHCLIGAIEVVQEEHPTLFWCADVIEDRLLSVVRRKSLYESIETFNDDRKTRHKDVLAVIAAARDEFVQKAMKKAMKKETSNAV